MNIAIIGAGNVGGALAASLTKAGHSVTISSRDPEDAADLAKRTGATAAASSEAAVSGAEAVILAVPFQAVGGLGAELRAALEGKVVVDVTNRVDPEDPGQTLDGTSVAEQLQAQVPGARVVKAFNTVFASNQADPMVEGRELDGFVAADDQEAKEAVLGLADSIGFRPIDAGPLAMARALEAMAALNIILQLKNDWSWQTGWKLIGPTEA
jgi:hypothetical protein